VLVEYKYLGNWRQIVRLNNKDLCEFLSRPGAKNRWAYEMLNELSSEAVHHCPFLPGRIEIVNLTNFEVIEGLDGSEPALLDYQKKRNSHLLMKKMFKGDLRGTVTLKTKADPKVIHVSGVYTVSEQKYDTF